MNLFGFSEASSSCLWWDSDMQWHLKPFCQQTQETNQAKTPTATTNTRNYTDLTNFPPHLGIVFDTSDNTTSTSGDLWILSGWLSPWGRENPLFPFWPAVKNFLKKTPAMYQLITLTLRESLSLLEPRLKHEHSLQLPRFQRHNLARKLKTRDNIWCVQGSL